MYAPMAILKFPECGQNFISKAENITGDKRKVIKQISLIISHNS